MWCSTTAAPFQRHPRSCKRSQVNSMAISLCNTKTAGVYYRRTVSPSTSDSAPRTRQNLPTRESLHLKCCSAAGIGAYTGNAIASIACKEHVAVVDANVVRVLARLRRLAGDPKLAVKQHAALADALLDPERPGDFNQVAPLGCFAKLLCASECLARMRSTASKREGAVLPTHMAASAHSVQSVAMRSGPHASMYRYLGKLSMHHPAELGAGLRRR